MLIEHKPGVLRPELISLRASFKEQLSKIKAYKMESTEVLWKRSVPVEVDVMKYIGAKPLSILDAMIKMCDDAYDRELRVFLSHEDVEFIENLKSKDIEQYAATSIRED